MNPYEYVRLNTLDKETLLSLCTGIGFELQGNTASKITAVDISAPYCEVLKGKFPNITVINSPAHLYLQNEDTESYDIVSCIDGLEHMTKEEGIILLEEAKRVCKKRVIIFTQIGYLRNEPHDAWGISGADEYQTHKSGWEVSEVESFGYKLVDQWDDISQHGEKYTAVVYYYNKD